MIQSMEEEDKVGLYDEYRGNDISLLNSRHTIRLIFFFVPIALLLNKQGQLNRDGGVFTDWGDEGMGDANAMRRRRRRKMVGADGVEYEEEEEGEEEEEALRYLYSLNFFFFFSNHSPIKIDCQMGSVQPQKSLLFVS